MATNSTDNYLIPYPNPGDPVNVAGDLADLAIKVDDVLFSKVSRTFTNTFTAPQVFEVLVDPVGVSPVPPAIRITQSGTGDALVVTDNGYPDSSPFVIDNSGNVAIGKTTASVPLDVVGNATFTGTVTGNLFSGSGASLTSLNGSNISSGTVADARIDSAIARINSPSFTTPSLGVATATTINGTSIPTSKTLVVTTDIGTSVQAWDADLDSISGLSGTSGLLKKTAANTWVLDTAAYSTTVGTVTSVGMTVPTGLSVTPSTITSSGTFAISLATGYSIPTTTSQTNWDTAYTDRNKWDGGSTGLNATTGRNSLGATTVGSNIFTLTNPSALSYVRIDATNNVTAASASTIKTDLALNNVENTALSTWTGNTSINSVGTIGTGIWSATQIAVTRGGTGLTAGPTANGQLLIGSSTGSYALATLTQGSNIGITNGAGSITISLASNLTGLGTISGTSFNSITGLSSANPLMNGSVAVGTSTSVSREDHIHPTDTTRAPLASPQFTGTVTIPISSVTSYQKFATTATVAVANYTVLDTDTYLYFNRNGGVNVTLPAAASYAGRMLYFKNIGTGAVTSASSNVSPQLSATLGTAILAGTYGKYAILISNGSNWDIFASN